MQVRQPLISTDRRLFLVKACELTLHPDLASTVPAPTSGDTPALPADLEQNSVGISLPCPLTTTISPMLLADDSQSSNLAPTMSTSPQTEQSSNLTAWAGLWVLLNVLSEPTGDSPPPNSSFDGLVRCIDIYEDQVSVPEGYERLAAKLHDLCRDISGFIDEAAPPLSAPRDSVWSVAYSSDEARIVSGSSDNTIRIWDARIGKMIGQPLQGHTNSVFSAAYSSDGARIVSGSFDKTIRIWDAHSAQAPG
ncbi:hypothetical protein FRC08_011424 [Ceratobasidium sp. 394]|nr:hypothetical protein FRC08_011424 [Ceratobasidium sp. 394]